MRRAAAGLLLLLALAGVGCDRATTPPPDPASLEVPEPDLSAMEPALAHRLERARQEVARRAAGEGEPASIGRAFGELGQLYYIFDLKDAAETAFANASRLDPGSFRWAYLLANTRLEKGDHEAAVETFRRVLEIRPDSVPARIHMGDAQLELDRPETAREHFARAVELAPDAAAALFGLGRVAADQGDAATAVDHFERALELQPDASTVHYPLAQAYRQLGRTTEARRHLELRGNARLRIDDSIAEELRDLKTLTTFRILQSLAADPDDTTVEELLGFAFAQLGDIRGTVPQLEKVIEERNRELSPDPRELARLHHVTGALAVQRGDDRRALEHFRQALELDPELTDARVKLGNALARTGRLEEAVAEFSRLLEAEPDEPAWRLKRATAHLNLGNPEAAVEDLRTLLEEDPEDPVVHIRLAQALEVVGATDQAEERYEQALERQLGGRELARIHTAFGEFLQRRGRLQEALEEFERAIELDGEQLTARRRRAALLGHLGRFAEAAQEYQTVVTRSPDDEVARLGEVTALILGGRLEEARRRLASGVESLPTAHRLAQLLARLLAAAPEPSLRDGGRAVELARRAFDAEPSPIGAETLAMALAEAGRYEEAVEWQQRLVEQLEGRAPAAAAEAQARLSLYRARRPYRVKRYEALLLPAPAGAG